MKNLQKILPPTLFYAFSLLIGLDFWLPGSPRLIGYPFNILAGLPLTVIGLGLSVYYSRYFHKHGVNIMTFGEPTELVTSGMFRYSRHPIYLGLVTALSGISVLASASLLSLGLLFVFFLVINFWYIPYEETMMHAKFGQAYRDYCRAVRRWL